MRPLLNFLTLILHVLQSARRRSGVAQDSPIGNNRFHGTKGDDRLREGQLHVVKQQSLRPLGDGHVAQYDPQRSEYGKVPYQEPWWLFYAA